MIQIVLLRKDASGKNYHCHPKGFPKGLVVPNIDALFKNLGDILEKLRAADPDNLKNVFYCVGHHAGLGGDMPVRNKLSYEYQSILAFDIDHVDINRAWDYLPIVAGILGVSPQSLIFVSTGNGLHIAAHLKTPIRSNKYLEQTKPHYNELIYRINTALKDRNLPGEADHSIYDAPRILRLPNSINDKKDRLTESKLLQYPGLVLLDLDVIALSGLSKTEIENLSPQHLKKNYPRPDFAYVASQCEFMKVAVAKPEQIHEPQFQLLVGILGAMSPGDRIEYGGNLATAKELAKGVFESASSSKSLQGSDFERKWEHGLRYGAAKCSTVSQNYLGVCEACPHQHKVNTPLALKSQEHVGSSANGYWVIGSKGPTHPHYSDCARLYQKAHSYTACEPDILFTFKNKKYEETGQLMVKSWLEKNIGYEEHLRESHCVEFSKKIMRSNILSKEQEIDLFVNSTRGKINCQNGIVDVRTGEIIPHSPQFGFKYVLPYDYEPDQVSEIFLDWLAEVMQNRVELMESVLDMMAYCLWPSYEDHVFAFFIGEGRNGKSTLLHIMQELLGRLNYSAISMTQLGNNRFAPANLDGKLANISEESSGDDLSVEELNILKDLSAGGELTVERKGQQQYQMRNSAKMIFSANKTPRFHESGKALRARLLVLPFDHTFENPDPRIEAQLILEVPRIFSMLVTRARENVALNGGKFKVSRGGSSAAVAQDKVLLTGNSVIEWSKEALESGINFAEEQYVAVRDAYDKYKIWCLESNYKAVNVHSFGSTMVRGALSSIIKESKAKKIGGKTIRVYPHTQWKEDYV